MQIIYPYNEILPLKKAHDAYIIRWCASLANEGHDVFLLIGQGSLDKKALFNFYKISLDNPLKIIYLPILRRKNLLRLQANAVFFWFAQREIEKKKPDLIIFSVMKQSRYHLKRKVKGCLYLYEVHQLRWYPTVQSSTNFKKIREEKYILSHCDAITVTTYPLKKILQRHPYALKNLIEKVPLACDFQKIQTRPRSTQNIQLYYVGQLYLEQGLKLLLQAMQNIQGITLNIVGGKPHEVKALQHYCKEHQLQDKIQLLGFMDTEMLQREVQKADAFITTFQKQERMPYVAHTKLTEYRAWQRPIIAPDMEIVYEEVPQGVLHFEPGNLKSLTKALCQIQSREVYESLLLDIQKNPAPNWKKRGCLFNKVLNKMHSCSSND